MVQLDTGIQKQEKRLLNLLYLMMENGIITPEGYFNASKNGAKHLMVLISPTGSSLH